MQESKRLRISVIGGGAAGFFAAINIAIQNPEAQISLLEKSSKLLSKVRVSGGGRCNVTHACFENGILVKQYPRGEKELRNLFSRFSTSDTIKWFEERGVHLKTEDDGRMFPSTDSSETIIACLMKEAEKLGVRIKMNTDIVSIKKEEDGSFVLAERNGGEILSDKVLIASGGNPKNEAYSWIRELGHTVVPPVPSLFTFNIPGNTITNLMGVSVPQARVKINGTKLETEGPLLITHWGLSGPAILKASAWGARILFDRNYEFTVNVTWLPKLNEEKLRIILRDHKDEHAARSIQNSVPVELPRRLWEFLVHKSGLDTEMRWADLSKKSMNVLVQHLIADEYQVSGKTTFKEEFVTCGGVSLREIDFATMESKIVRGLYFAGEVMDIDGITGGFNFQNAWSSAWVAAQNIGK
jgi:predicted Rossmann fold flavoprotein